MWLQSFYGWYQLALAVVKGLVGIGRCEGTKPLYEMLQGSMFSPLMFNIYNKLLGEVDEVICQFGIWYYPHTDDTNYTFRFQVG